MTKHLMAFLKGVRKSFLMHLSNRTANIFIPTYRIVSIKQNEADDYEISVQVVGTATVIKMKPEEILADDDLTNKFSPTDVRTLTYLGYLDMNSPKYKILARRLSEKDNKVVFALHKKGSKNVEIKVASEISQNPDILKQLNSEDVHMVSYIAGTEYSQEEKVEKEKLLKSNEGQKPLGD